MANYELTNNAAFAADKLYVTSHPIYGSSRLGVDNRKTLLYNAGVNQSVDSPLVVKYRVIAMKSYELSNHLGNVLVTVSDKKIPKTLAVNTVDYFEADITTISDYYAFGSAMPTRTWSDPNSKYKYGFNGKEKDNDINVDGGSYDFGARIYDSRLGRWLALDPLMKKFISMSPYNYSFCSPLRFKDPDGCDVIIAGLSNFHRNGVQCLSNSPLICSILNKFTSKVNGSQVFHTHSSDKSNGSLSANNDIIFTSVGRGTAQGLNMIANNQDAVSTLNYVLTDGTIVAASAWVAVPGGPTVARTQISLQILDDNAYGINNLFENPTLNPLNPIATPNQNALATAYTAEAVTNNIYNQVSGLTSLIENNTDANGVTNYTALSLAVAGTAPAPDNIGLTSALNELTQKCNATATASSYASYDQIDIGTGNVNCRSVISVGYLIGNIGRDSSPPIVSQNYSSTIVKNITNSGTSTTNVNYVPTPTNNRTSTPSRDCN